MKVGCCGDTLLFKLDLRNRRTPRSFAIQGNVQRLIVGLVVIMLAELLVPSEQSGLEFIWLDERQDSADGVVRGDSVCETGKT